MDQMQQIVFNDYVDATLAGLFILVVVSVLVFGIRTIMAARAQSRPTVNETPFQAMPGGGAVPG
jgi:carbon starvation protein